MTEPDYDAEAKRIYAEHRKVLFERHRKPITVHIAAALRQAHANGSAEQKRFRSPFGDHYYTTPKGEDVFIRAQFVQGHIIIAACTFDELYDENPLKYDSIEQAEKRGEARERERITALADKVIVSLRPSWPRDRMPRPDDPYCEVDREAMNALLQAIRGIKE